MTRYVALLRGINVGGKNSLSMKELTAALEGLGCSYVRTWIQSGNVVFDHASPEASLAEAIATEILRRRGFRPHVLVLEASEFERMAADNPFPEGESDPRALHLGFLETVPSSPDLESLQAVKAPSESFELIDRVFYLLAPDGVGRSKLAAKSEKALGVPMTDRNWKTVCAILEMLKAPGE